MRAIICFVLLALLATPVRAQDAGAKAFLDAVYAPYRTSEKALDITSERKAARWFVPQVAKLIGRDLAESKRKNEVGRLDFDPFIGGQDWSPKTKLDVAVAPGASADRATGTARYRLAGEKEDTVITLDLVKAKEGWRISDIHWSGQAESLAQLLSKK